MILRDTLDRLLRRLTPAELKCYGLLKEGHEQKDLPGIMGVSRQAVSKILTSIRRKYEESGVGGPIVASSRTGAASNRPGTCARGIGREVPSHDRRLPPGVCLPGHSQSA